MRADAAHRLVAAGCVRVNGKVAQVQRRLWGGETIEVDAPAPRALARLEGPPIPVLFEDERLLIVDKPPGVVVEPAPSGPRTTHGRLDSARRERRRPLTPSEVEGSATPADPPGAVEAGSERAPSLIQLLASQRAGFDVAGLAAPGVVHRLDRDTSGCVAVAKTDEAVAVLSAAFEGKRATKHYLALVLGRAAPTGSLDTPFGRDPTNPRLFSSRTPSARRARLTWTVAEAFADATLLEVTLDTGRTHQIRVQLADVGLPVLADPVYGPKAAREHPAAAALGRLALHAVSLRIDLPGGAVSARAPLPPDFERALDLLRRGGMSPSP